MGQDTEAAGRSVYSDAVLEMALNKERMFCMLHHHVIFLELHFSFLIHEDLCAPYLTLPECGFFFSLVPISTELALPYQTIRRLLSVISA